MPSSSIAGVPVTDSFTRANGNIGASYLVNPLNDGGGTPQIVSNAIQVAGATLSGVSAAFTDYRVGPNSGAIVRVGVAPATSGISEIHLLLRLNNPSASLNTANGYEFQYTRNGATILGQYIRYDAAVGTQLGADEVITALGAGDQLGFTVVGSTLQAWRCPSGGVWATYGASRTDATYSAQGYGGIVMYEDVRTMSLDDLGFGSIGVASAISLGPAGPVVQRRSRR